MGVIKACRVMYIAFYSGLSGQVLHHYMFVSVFIYLSFIFGIYAQLVVFIFVFNCLRVVQ